MSAPLVIKNGDVAGSYKNHILAGTLGLRKWKRDFKAAFVAYNGKPILNGKPHFGGRCDVSNFSVERANDLGDVCGMDDDSKQEVINVFNQGDVSTYINLVANRIYTLDALWAHLRDDVSPQIPLGSSVTISKDYEISVPQNDPAPAAPTQSLKIAAAQSVDATMIYAGLLTAELNEIIGHLYHSTQLFENHADLVTLSSSTPVFDRSDLTSDIYTYTATVTIDIGATDISYLANRSILDLEVFSSIHLGDIDSLYFVNSTSTRTKFISYNRYDWNTIAGVIWNYVNNWVEGSSGSFYNIAPTIEGTYYHSDGAWSSLYIDEEYWDNLSMLETMVLVQQTINLGAEELGGGFWDTFVGKILGELLTLITKVIDFIDNLPVINPIILSLEWGMEIAGVDENFIEDFDSVYRKLRTMVLLYYAVPMAKAGFAAQASGEASFAAGAELGAEWASSQLVTSGITEIGMDIAKIILEVSMAQKEGEDEKTELEIEEEELYGISLEEDNINAPDGDYVDTAYWYMDNPLQAMP